MTHGCRMKLLFFRQILKTQMSREEFLHSPGMQQYLTAEQIRWYADRYDSSVYHFGDGKPYDATKIEEYQVMIEIDRLDNDILLLLLGALMKRANMNLNKNVTESVVGETTDLANTKSRLYAIPLTIPCRIVHNRNSKNINVTLST